MQHREAIKAGLAAQKPPQDLARKIYVTYPSFAFEGKIDLRFEILDEISKKFNLPIYQILIAGSAHTGESFHKESRFCEGVSDLDVAIVSDRLFLEYLEYSNRATNGYTDLSKFERKGGQSVHLDFLQYLAKGYFRPDLMPQCGAKKTWWDFFQKLSQKHLKRFGSINAGIYSSLEIFEFKQQENIYKVK